MRRGRRVAAFDGVDGPSFGLFPPDKVLSREEIERKAGDAETSPVLKRALRYVLDHPSLFDSLARSQGADTQGISRSDLQIGIEDARRSAAEASAGPGAEGEPSGLERNHRHDEVVHQLQHPEQ